VVPPNPGKQKGTCALSDDKPIPKLRTTGKTREKLIAGIINKYKSGLAIRGIATQTGMSYGFVRRALMDNKVKLRPRGGQYGPTERPAAGMAGRRDHARSTP
jgi:hypothetical protein